MTSTIKAETERARQIRTEASERITELKAEIMAVKARRDEELSKIKGIIEDIRAERNAKIQANAAKRQAKGQAKAESEARLRQQAMEAASRKAKEWAAKTHPDHGGSNEEFRTAYAIWKDLEALAKQG